jgi:hypothetical protein
MSGSLLPAAVVNQDGNEQPPAQAVVEEDGRVQARAGEDESPAQTLMGGRRMGNFWIEMGFSLELPAFYWRL